jgi:hypothetical protein
MIHTIQYFEQFDIVLEQTKPDNSQRTKKVYTVRYGKQTTTGLDYAQACHELGACLMHAFYCESLALED